MGLLDSLTSTKRPEPDTPVCSQDEVRKRILAVNRPTAPFQIIDGSSEGVDLIAEWKIVDAEWHEIFAKAGLEKVFKIYLKFDDSEKAVRTKDYQYALSWSAGVPNLELSSSKTWGRRSPSSSAQRTRSLKSFVQARCTTTASRPAS